MTNIPLEGSVLRWARERTGLSVEDVAGHLNRGREIEKWARKLDMWEEGTESPPSGKVKSLSEIYAVPRIALYLPKPPREEPLDLPDFRTVADRPPDGFSVPLRQLVRSLRKQQQVVKRIILQEAPDSVVPVSYGDDNQSVSDLARKIEVALDFSIEKRKFYGKEDYLRRLVKKARALGVFVVRLKRIPGSKQGLHDFRVEEFRGFALCDKVAPFIFVNANDAIAAQIFTVMHELAHVWCEKTGLSNFNHLGDHGIPMKIERYCNAVAAEFLVPEVSLRKESMRYDIQSNIKRYIPMLADQFNISRIVLARRLRDLGLLDDKLYWSYFNALKRQWKIADEKRREQKKSISSYTVRSSHYGDNLISLLSRAVITGQLATTEAARIVNVKPLSFVNWAEKVNNA